MCWKGMTCFEFYWFLDISCLKKWMTSFARSPPATPMAAASMVSVELNGGCISMQQTNIAMEKTQLILKWTVFSSWSDWIHTFKTAFSTFWLLVLDYRLKGLNLMATRHGCLQWHFLFCCFPRTWRVTQLFRRVVSWPWPFVNHGIRKRCRLNGEQFQKKRFWTSIRILAISVPVNLLRRLAAETTFISSGVLGYVCTVHVMFQKVPVKAKIVKQEGSKSSISATMAEGEAALRDHFRQWWSEAPMDMRAADQDLSCNGWSPMWGPCLFWMKAASMPSPLPTWCILQWSRSPAVLDGGASAEPLCWPKWTFGWRPGLPDWGADVLKTTIVLSTSGPKPALHMTKSQLGSAG